MSVESFIDMLYGSLFWLALAAFLLIVGYTIYSSMEKG